MRAAVLDEARQNRRACEPRALDASVVEHASGVERRDRGHRWPRAAELPSGSISRPRKSHVCAELCSVWVWVVGVGGVVVGVVFWNKTLQGTHLRAIECQTELLNNQSPVRRGSRGAASPSAASCRRRIKAAGATTGELGWRHGGDWYGWGHVTLSHSRFVSVVWASVAIGFPVLSTDRLQPPVHIVSK